MRWSSPSLEPTVARSPNGFRLGSNSAKREVGNRERCAIASLHNWRSHFNSIYDLLLRQMRK
ncbi:hypothetical protein CKA32_006271 [Geitlerinema sp. FC II]|nr:hypothetical protein CKA32_006271 [Geitlerinema sp. FC II]